MDNASDKTITFDKQGRCNYCSDVLSRMPTEYFPNGEGKRRLDALVRQIKEAGKNESYDCLVGVSGGIDSSYILYIGYQYRLRMLAVHIDDGLDNPIAVENLQKLMEKTKTKMISIQPDRAEYADILKSLLKASVPDLAIAQDNLIISALDHYGKENHIHYSLDGRNFAHECILEHGIGVNACDKKFILGIQKKFGEVPIRHLKFISLSDRYLLRHANGRIRYIRPLNLIPYHLERAISELTEFCGFQYYGGKHYESILTRFMQCYYLPKKFGVDKRKSHYSSLIATGQMTRDEALTLLKKPLYPSKEMLEEDIRFLAGYIGVSVDEFNGYIDRPPKSEFDYPHSFLNGLAPAARKMRKFLE